MKRGKNVDENIQCGKKCELTGIYAESDDFRFAQSTASVMTPGSKIAALPGSNPRHKKKRPTDRSLQGAQWDSNPRHSEPQSDALTN